MSLEEAVRRLTTDPADFYRIRDRGRLREGLAADITIFDPATVGSSNRGERRYDLPGGAKRMVMPSRGILHTIVNGEAVWESGAMTDRRPGQVLPLLKFAASCPVYFDRHTLSLKPGQLSLYTMDGRMRFELALASDKLALFNAAAQIQTRFGKKALPNCKIERDDPAKATKP